MAVVSERESLHPLQVKNSLRAVNDRFEDSDDVPPPVRVIVAEGDEDVTIKAGSCFTFTASLKETAGLHAPAGSAARSAHAGQDIEICSAVGLVRNLALQSMKGAGLLLLSTSGCRKERVCAETGALLTGV